MKKVLYLFIVIFPLFIGGCKFATEPPLPIIPQESIVIISTTVEEVTATTVLLKTTVTTNKSVTVTFQYGVTDYTNTINPTPSSFNGVTSLNARITNLTPNTTYKFRIKSEQGTIAYPEIPTFTTLSEPLSVSVTSISVETTATTAEIKAIVNSNKFVEVSFEYGINNYAIIVSPTPNIVNGNVAVSAKISNLTPGTTYKYRIKAGDGYFGDSTFTTNSQLQIGDIWKKGKVAEVYTINGVQHGLLIALVDQSDSTKGMAYAEAIEACKNYGEGYRLPDSTELKIMKNAFDAGILNNIVRIGVTLYLSSSEMPGNSDWIFCLDFKTGKYGWINKLSHANVRAVCKF